MWIQTQAKQLKDECAHLDAILPAQDDRTKEMVGTCIENVRLEEDCDENSTIVAYLISKRFT